jgi:hypothetical protein
MVEKLGSRRWLRSVKLSEIAWEVSDASVASRQIVELHPPRREAIR